MAITPDDREAHVGIPVIQIHLNVPRAHPPQVVDETIPCPRAEDVRKPVRPRLLQNFRIFLLLENHSRVGDVEKDAIEVLGEGIFVCREQVVARVQAFDVGGLDAYPFDEEMEFFVGSR